ncbi:hypothetical protein [Hyphomicrobium sp. 99]|uniref:hypothetical protein n=1 Tax=Hyphomicrobium sp. 99 TaxID=1163419 RepID=UPI000697F3A0|nr:hypothetical protein [Hyphomicrobium sp. 99]
MRIEAGKWYLNREGNCVGPMQRNKDATWFWKDGEERAYFFDGRAGVGPHPSPCDLVREWVNPDTPTEPPHDLVREQRFVREPYARVGKWVDAPTRPGSISYVETQEPIQSVETQAPAQNDDATYDSLVRVLADAHAQASRGKGKERHANGRPFDRQPIMELGRMYGPGFAAGQAAKKAQEAMGMVARGHRNAAVFELLGSINYLAACVMLIREQQAS